MSCELIRVNFKKGVIESRETLTEDGRAEYVPFQDEHFKMMTRETAELANMAHKHGANPRRMVVLVIDEQAEFDASMYDSEVLSDEEVIAGLKRAVAKILAQSQGPSPEPGASA